MDSSEHVHRSSKLKCHSPFAVDSNIYDMESPLLFLTLPPKMCTVTKVPDVCGRRTAMRLSRND